MKIHTHDLERPHTSPAPRRVARALWSPWLAALACAVACGPVGGDGGEGGGGADVECVSRCIDKAISCGAEQGPAANACQSDYCAGSQTEAYVSCLESVPCTTVAEPDTLKSTCGYSESGGGGGGDDCSGYPKCDGNTVRTCSIENGARVIEGNACGSNATCEDAKCEQNACIESGRTGCNSGNNPSNCCDDRQSCSGNGNAAGETVCCVAGNKPCSQDSDCCGYDSPDNKWLCTNDVCTFTLGE